MNAQLLIEELDPIQLDNQRVLRSCRVEKEHFKLGNTLKDDLYLPDMPSVESLISNAREFTWISTDSESICLINGKEMSQGEKVELKDQDVIDITHGEHRTRLRVRLMETHAKPFQELHFQDISHLDEKPKKARLKLELMIFQERENGLNPMRCKQFKKGQRIFFGPEKGCLWSHPLFPEKQEFAHFKKDRAFVQIPKGFRTLVGSPELSEKNPTLLIGDGRYRILARLVYESPKITMPWSSPIPRELMKPFLMSFAFVFGLFILIHWLRMENDEPIEKDFTRYTTRIEEILPQAKPKKVKPKRTKPTSNANSKKGGKAAGNTAKSGGGGTQGAFDSNAMASLIGEAVSNPSGGKQALSAPVAENVSANPSSLSVPTGGTSKPRKKGKKPASIGIGKLNKNNPGAKGIGEGIGGGVGAGGVVKGIENGDALPGLSIGDDAGDPLVEGGLEKSVIARVINQNIGQVRFCYERGLLLNPDLSGKIVANWDINASGNVQGTKIRQSTMNNNPVEQCILRRISKWKFPQPSGNTVVTVSYPFLFKSASN
jgi:hypothetical protein